jgi:prophage regulatory protein
MQQLLTFETLVELGYVNNRVTLSRRIRRGEFPAPIRVGSRNVAWLKTEIDAWESSRIAMRDRDLRLSNLAA